jgi:PQQ-dependent catabolism-associated CXXCW motif protein
VPAAYRGWPYKAPTPMSAPGAITLFFAEDVRALIEQTDILPVNVSPITLGPADAAGRRSWIPPRGKLKFQIPGSVWLPNVGYQSLDPAMDAYFSRNLAQHTGGDKSRPLLFYCTADCWMSWNSVKRARQEYGYRNLYWYPWGIDGWKEQDFELESAHPEPFDASPDS